MNRTHSKVGPIKTLQNNIGGTHLTNFNINAIQLILVNICKGGYPLYEQWSWIRAVFRKMCDKI